MSFTAVSPHVHAWAPLLALVHAQDDFIGYMAQHLWLQLYTGPEMKSGVPGLMIASVNSIAEATRKPADLVRTLLDRLLEHGLVEFDVKHRVLSMPILPDDNEFPTNANGIRSWWRRFRVIPETSPLRNAHVATLQWILDEHVRRTGKGLKPEVQQVWEESFGTIPIHATRRRATRHQQQELALNVLPEPSGSGDSLNEAAQSLNTYPQPQGPISEKSKINNSGDLCLTAVKQDQDQDQVSFLSGSGGGAGEGHEPGNASSSRPHLAIVPESTPYGPEQLLKALERDSGGRFLVSGDSSLWPALRGVVAHLCEHGVTLGGLALLSAWLGRKLAVEGTEGRPFLGEWWAAKPNVVLFAYQRAVIAEREAERLRLLREEDRAALRKALSEGPYNLHLS